MIEFFKIAFLFLIAWQGPIITVRAYCKVGVKAMSFVLLAIGVTGLVYLQFLM